MAIRVHSITVEIGGQRWVGIAFANDADRDRWLRDNGAVVLSELGFDGPFIAHALISCGFAILSSSCCPACIEEHRDSLAEAVEDLRSEHPREGHC